MAKKFVHVFLYVSWKNPQGLFSEPNVLLYLHVEFHIFISCIVSIIHFDLNFYYLVVAALFIEETILSSFEFSWHPYQKSIKHKCKDLFLNSHVYFNMFIIMPVSWCFGYYGFVRSFEIWSVSLLLFPFLSCFDYPASLKIPQEY